MTNYREILRLHSLGVPDIPNTGIFMTFLRLVIAQNICEYHVVYHAIHHFRTVDLSAQYRCWMYHEEVGSNVDNLEVCPRCASVLG